MNSVACDFAGVIGNGSIKVLEERVAEMANIQEAFERMGTKLYQLLNAGSQRDYEGDVGSARVE